MFRFFAAAAVAATLSVPASATTLTFDTDADCNHEMVTIYAGPNFADCVIAHSPNGTNGLAKQGLYASFWTADFSEAMKAVSIDLGDFGQDDDELFMIAFDQDGNWLDYTLYNIESTLSDMVTLSLHAYNIAGVAFGVTGDRGDGGIYADNLSFEVQAVPVPASALMLGTVLVGAGAALRRKKKA